MYGVFYPFLKRFYLLFVGSFILDNTVTKAPSALDFMSVGINK